jgi:RNA polymerase sigma-70 factor (ECF subfamily)
MLIKYEFLKGKAVEIEVEDEIGSVILQIENDTYNSDRRETRRHESLDDWNGKDRRLVDLSDETSNTVLRSLDAQALYRAIAKLKLDEQELIHKIYLETPPVTQAEYARAGGFSENYIRLKVCRIRDKLRKYLSQ